LNVVRERPQRLSAVVYDSIRRRIVAGDLAPNEKLSEADLAKELGVSRSPVRETLIRLTEEGLVRVMPQVGSFVTPISIEAVRQAQFIREHLECAIVVEASAAIDAGKISVLRENLAAQAAALKENDWKSFHFCDELLHETLTEIAGRGDIWEVILQFKVHMDRIRLLSDRTPEQMTRLIGQHTAVVDALEERDPQAAQRALREHLREVLRTIERLDLAAELQSVKRSGANAT
jgi:DNA-binding GntR family transcriptional regulator